MFLLNKVSPASSWTKNSNLLLFIIVIIHESPLKYPRNIHCINTTNFSSHTRPPVPLCTALVATFCRSVKCKWQFKESGEQANASSVPCGAPIAHFCEQLQQLLLLLSLLQLLLCLWKKVELPLLLLLVIGIVSCAAAK